jgi:hypothetical protein
MLRQECLVVAALACASVNAVAQTSDSPAAASAWSTRVSLATYVLPDDDNYVQPTIAADRDALHLEGRYNYEDRRSISGFVGWNLEAGSSLKLEVTPMIGGVAGNTNGVIPAIEATLSFRRLELYVEGEYVIDSGDSSNRYLYNWSEASLWLTDWLRIGGASQRTRVLRQPRDVQPGVLAGVSIKKIDGTLYVFNPGSSDKYIVAAVSIGF